MEAGCWREEVVKQCFDRQEANIILGLLTVESLCMCGVHKIIWHYTRHKLYLVKSCYELAQSSEMNDLFKRRGKGGSSGSEEIKNWASIWKF